MKNSGFSLIEAITAVSIFVMIILGIVALVSSILTTNNQQSNLLTDNNQALKVAFTVIRELRNAKTSATGSYALVTAANQQLIFYTDTGTEIDRINYFVQNGILKKGVTKPSGNPPVYDLNTETVTDVQNYLANLGNPIFYYYDDTYNGVVGNPLAQPVNVTAAKFVKVSVSIINRGGRNNTGSYTVTAGGTIRNLKTNLGN